MIYALLGLSCSEALVPDYSKSVEEVYIDAAKVIIRDISNGGRTSRPNLDIIHDAYRSCRSTKLKLPSWVPDWSIGQEFGLLIDWKNTYDAMRGLKLEETPVMDDANVLTISGIFLDSISVVKQLMQGTFGDHWDYKIWEPEDIAASSYFTREPALDTYWRTLLIDQGDDVGHRLKIDEYPQFRREYLIWSGRKPKTILEKLLPKAKWSKRSGVFDRLHKKLKGQAFASTTKGYFVIVPSITKEHDRIYLARGSKTPLVLQRREIQEDPSLDLLTLVGPAYVHGFVDAEIVTALQASEVSEEEVRIV